MNRSFNLLTFLIVLSFVFVVSFAFATGEKEPAAPNGRRS
jgi:hypothetical protein